jgi:uncharacterized protein (DUF1810 family)
LIASTPSRTLASPTPYVCALAELRGGRKRGNWIWFVLPQLPGFGRSALAQRYGISGLTEARAYLADPLLRQRLEALIDTSPPRALSTSWAAAWMQPRR